ncbi:hypothetical protein D3C81_1577250 [compost metagenome]
MHLLQPVRHQLERLAQPLLERRMELLVHGASHFLQFRGVVRLDVAQLLLERRPHLGQPAVVGLGHLRDLLILHRGDAGQVRRQGLLEAQHLPAGLIAAIAGGRTHFATQHALQPIKTIKQFRGCRPGARAPQQHRQQDHRHDGGGERQDGNQCHQFRNIRFSGGAP